MERSALPAGFQSFQKRVQKRRVNGQLDRIFYKADSCDGERIAVQDVQPQGRQKQIDHKHRRQACGEGDVYKRQA